MTNVEYMKVIFLDIDGVLNYDGCLAQFEGVNGIEPDCLGRLKRLVDTTGAKIVLISTWKEEFLCGDPLGDYMITAFKNAGINIFDMTSGHTSDRGAGISRYISDNPGCTEWVVIDDVVFDDYEEYGILDHLVQTSGESGGLQEWHVEQAIKILK